MGFEDRDYYRDQRPGFVGGIGQWLLYGRVSLFHFRGIHVQAHSSMFIVSALMLLQLAAGFTYADYLLSVGLLFGIVLLHEFGHCFGCRFMGGDADEIVMHPLGGLALCRPPSNWRAHLVTSAAGPAVNLAFCLIAGAALLVMTGQLPWQPVYAEPWEPARFSHWLDPVWMLFWLFATNWSLLMFNLLPIFPLDGGQIVQNVAWPFIGYYRSMLISCNVGMFAAVLFGLAAVLFGWTGLLLLAVLGFIYCQRMKQMLLEAGPYGFGEYDDPYAQSLASTGRSDARDRRRAQKLADRQAKQADQERQQRVADEAEIDRILAKVSASGMQSLSRSEQRTLREATARQQKHTQMHR